MWTSPPSRRAKALPQSLRRKEGTGFRQDRQRAFELHDNQIVVALTDRPQCRAPADCLPAWSRIGSAPASSSNPFECRIGLCRAGQHLRHGLFDQSLKDRASADRDRRPSAMRGGHRNGDRHGPVHGRSSFEALESSPSMIAAGMRLPAGAVDRAMERICAEGAWGRKSNA